MRNSSITTLAVALLVCMSNHSLGQTIAESRFESGDDGWFAVGDVAALTPHWIGVGPCSGACISITDYNKGGDQMLAATTKYVSGMAAAYGGSFSFDILLIGGVTDGRPVRDIMLVGAGLELTFDLPTPSSSCTSRSIPLVESSGWRIARTSVVPSRQQFRSVLGSMNGFLILAEYGDGIDIVYLDNVVLSGPTPSMCVTITQQPRHADALSSRLSRSLLTKPMLAPLPSINIARTESTFLVIEVQGTNAKVLTINDTAPADSGDYTCVVTNSCGTATSDSARVTISCPADFDDGSGSGAPDGDVTIDDLLYFLDRFTVGF